jgi:S1-C subfamily serine protease
MKLAAAVLALALGGAAIHSCSAQPPYEKAKLATITLGVPGGGCSATAVGRFTLLTASHCVADGANAVVVDGKQCEVWKIVHDGYDHALLTIDSDCPQEHIAKPGKAPKIGDTVFCWGNPGCFEDLLRVGQVVGYGLMPKEWGEAAEPYKHKAYFLTGPFAHGDSGAALFNQRGEIVGTVSFGAGSLTIPADLISGMWTLHFTDEQWAGL